MSFDRDDERNPDDEEENIVSEDEGDEAENVVSEDEEADAENIVSEDEEDDAENVVSENENYTANQTAPAYEAPQNAYVEGDDKPESSAAKPTKAESPYAILARHGFVLKKALKSGITGDVALFAYTGPDERVKALMVNGMVLVKLQTPQTEVTFDPKEIIKREHAGATYKNEWDNINQRLGNVPSGTELLRPGTLALDLDGAKIILNECVYANAEKTSAKDLEQYMTELGMDRKGMLDAGKAMRPDEIAGDLQIFAKIFTGLVEAQAQLHRDGILHLDTAPRNYFMTASGGVKVGDFGASLQMGADGKALNDPYFKINPVCIYNRAAVLPKKNPESAKSIMTDMFSRKIAMMEAMAIYMGIPASPGSELNNRLHFRNLAGNDNLSKLYGVDDVTRLKNSLNNLTNYAEELIAKNDPRGAVVMTVVKQYRQYLTSIPAGSNANEIEMNDQAAFAKGRQVQNTAGILQELSAGKPINKTFVAAVLDEIQQGGNAVPGKKGDNKAEPAVKAAPEKRPGTINASADQGSLAQDFTDVNRKSLPPIIPIGQTYFHR